MTQLSKTPYKNDKQLISQGSKETTDKATKQEKQQLFETNHFLFVCAYNKYSLFIRPP